jgi:pyruvate/2-oxoglutarate/acetoin dehydrogenase E1 component
MEAKTVKMEKTAKNVDAEWFACAVAKTQKLVRVENANLQRSVKSRVCSTITHAQFIFHQAVH